MPEENAFSPSSDFVTRARVQGMDGYRDLYDRAKDHPEVFWGELAGRELDWFQKWSHVFEWAPPNVKWFVGGKLNAAALPGAADSLMSRSGRRTSPAV